MRLGGRRALVLLAFGALTIAAAAACSSFTAEPSGSADDAGAEGASDAAADAPAPSLGCPTSCLPPAPRGWIGPSAVSDGVANGADPACPAEYPDRDVVAGHELDAPPATCACNAGTIAGASCLVGYAITTSGCSVVMSANIYVPQPSGNPACVDTGAAQTWFVNPASIDAGSCSFPKAIAAVPDAGFAKHAISCGRSSDPPCEGRPECTSIPDPGGSFTRVCVHQTGDVPCPSEDYAARFVAFTGVDDKRGCTACTGPGATSCGTTYGIGNSCADALNNSTSVDSANCRSGSATFRLDALGPQQTACDASAPSVPTGAAKESGPVTFCCNR
jgi:hypothetical protein